MYILLKCIGGRIYATVYSNPLEGAIKESLLSLQKQWYQLGMRGHFIPPEKLHLTLAFIGEYGNPDDIMGAISAVSFQPFTIQLDGAGNFHDAYWAGDSTKRISC